jgi:hypothetical protein
MLLLVRGPLRDIVTFCAFEKIGVPTTTEKRHQQERVVARGRGLIENWLANYRRDITI